MADTPSPVDDLLHMREKIGREREPKLFDLPVYGKALQAKYRVLSRTERKEAQGFVFKLVKAGEERPVEIGYCKTLALACVGIFTEGKPVNKAWGLGDEPVLWGDPRLAAQFKMGNASPNAREIIEYVFNGDDDALEEHHNEVSRWMEQSWETDDSDF